MTINQIHTSTSRPRLQQLWYDRGYHGSYEHNSRAVIEVLCLLGLEPCNAFEIGLVSKITRESKGKNKRTRIYQCMACGKQFRANSGTIFNASHLPLVKWFIAIALVCEAKKDVAACQIQRHIGGSYRTAWYLAHRIREAMQEGGLLSGVVETDETYLTSKKPHKGRPYVADGT